MNYISWTRDTPVILYGAAFSGTKIYRYISEFCNIVAFIDKRADEIESCMGLPVYDLKSEKTDKNSILIVCVKNVFEHEKIVIDLLKYGYQYIIYMPVDFSCYSYKCETTRKIIKNIYNLITDDKLIIPCQVPSVIDLFHIEWKDHSLIKNEDGLITAMIPAFFVYTDIGESIWYNIPIYSLFPHYIFFNYLSGDINADPNFYIDKFCLFSAKIIGDYNTTHRWRQNILDNRRMVYEKMNLAYDLSSSFFTDNAPNAYWNDNGYFNLDSGKHRATFFLHKKNRFIPLKISEKDYISYLNIPVANEIIAYIEKHNISELPYPVLHPLFIYFPYKIKNNFYKSFHAITCWLSEKLYNKRNKADFNGVSILDTTKYMYPITQCFNKLGCYVDFTYENNELFSLISRLYFICQVHNKSNKHDIIILDFNEIENASVNAAEYYIIILKNEEMLVKAQRKIKVKLELLGLINLDKDEYLLAVGEQNK